MVTIMVPILSCPLTVIGTPGTLIGLFVTFKHFIDEINDIFDEYDNLPERFIEPELAECVDYEMIDDSFILTEKEKINVEIFDEMRSYKKLMIAYFVTFCLIFMSLLIAGISACIHMCKDPPNQHPIPVNAEE